jgi:hypothetical protein
MGLDGGKGLEEENPPPSSSSFFSFLYIFSFSLYFSYIFSLFFIIIFYNDYFLYSKVELPSFFNPGWPLVWMELFSEIFTTLPYTWTFV